MPRRRMADEGCGIARGFDLLGERWTALILRDVLRGITRFGELASGLGVAPDVLSDRLGKLVDAGVLARIPYQEDGQRSRSEYVVTESGHRLAIALAAVNDWADVYRPAPSGAVGGSRFVEGTTGRPVRAVFVTDDGAIVDDADVELRSRSVSG